MICCVDFALWGMPYCVEWFVLAVMSGDCVAVFLVSCCSLLGFCLVC